MDKTAWYWFVGEIFIGGAAIIYLWIFTPETLMTVWNQWGIPLTIFALIFLTYPFYKLIVYNTYDHQGNSRENSQR